jgi:hypothetical protein
MAPKTSRRSQTLASWVLAPPEHVLPMAKQTDYSLVCTVDSDLPGAGLPERDVNDTSPTDKASHRAQLGMRTFPSLASILAQACNALVGGRGGVPVAGVTGALADG